MSWIFGSELFKVFLALVVFPALYWIGRGTLFLLLPKESYKLLTSQGLFRTQKPDEARSDMIFSNEAMAIAFLGLSVCVVAIVVLQACGVDVTGYFSAAPVAGPRPGCSQGS